MGLSKKIIDRGREKLGHDIFFGRKRFKYLKEHTNRMLQDSSRVWDSLPPPTTKANKEYREQALMIASLGAAFLARIREGEEYRRSIQFRHCTYVKYYDSRHRRSVYACRFFKLVDGLYKTNFFIISDRKSKKGHPISLTKEAAIADLPVTEEGRFRHVSHSFTCFNVFFYPKAGEKYHYRMEGKTGRRLNARLNS